MERRKRRKYNRKGCNTHISLEVIKQYLLHGAYPTGSTPPEKRSVRKRSESFKLENNVLYYVVRPKTVEGEIPDPNHRANKQNLRKAIISVKDQLTVTSSEHLRGNGGSHMGIERTLASLSSKYYWVGMAATVKKVLKNCVVCLANRPAVSFAPNDPEGSKPTQSWEPETPFFLPKAAEPNTPSHMPLPKVVETDTPGPMLLPNTPLFLPKVAVTEEESEVLPLKEDTDDKCEVFTEVENQFVVTNELTEPADIDSDLDFEQESTIADKIFESDIDVHRARRFWQKVELQTFGPFLFKRSNSKFVVAVLDSYSNWPEVHALEDVDEKTVSRFLLKLIARFGVMENLILLENEVSAKKPLNASGISQNLQAFTVNVSKEENNPMDEIWCKLSESIQRFVSVYTQEWPDCLELCLLPLRNTVSQRTEFTPSYLLMGRDANFPGVILPSKESENSETSLSKEQIHQASNEAMSIYHECSVPDIKHVIESAVPITLDVSENQGSAPQPMPKVVGQRKSTRRKNKSAVRIDRDEENVNKTSHGSKDNNEAVVSGKSGNQEVNGEEETEDLMEKVSLDTFYKIIHLYKLKEKFPANCPTDFISKICKAADAFALENEVLMFKGRGESGCLRRTVMTTEERLSTLSEGHVQNGEHVSQYKVAEYFNANRLYWRAMHADAKAFVTACPSCKYGDPKKRKSANYSHWSKAAEPMDGNDSDDETSSGKMTYEDLWMYIKKGATPDTLSRSALLAFRRKAKRFKIEKGILYYYPPGDGKKTPRKVLKTEKEKQEVLAKAHLGSGDEHLGESIIKDKLKESVFWYGMLDDVQKFLAECPHYRTSDQAIAVDNRPESGFEERIKLFQDYFAGENIIPPQQCLDSLFLAKSNNESKADEVPDSNPAQIIVLDKADGANNTSQIEVTVSNCSDSHESMPFECNIEAVVSEDQKVVKPELNLEDAEDQQYPCQDNGAEVEIDEIGDDDTSDTVSQPIANEVEQVVVVPTDLRKTPLSIPKLPKTRKRCNICNAVVLGENNFKAHMYKHTGVKPFECSHCHKYYSNIKGLRLHARKHSGHRPFLCNICGRGFPRSASLRYHMKTHERGNSPITCDICHRTFTSVNRLTKHKSFKHPAEEPIYSCEQCGKRFTAKRSLKRHEEAHKGIRKYQCQYCKRKFFRKEYLDYHLVSHASEDPSLLENHKFRSKSKRPVPSALKRKRIGSNVFTVDLNNPPGIDQAGNQEAFGQVVEVPMPDGWPRLQREQTLVYELGPDETLVPTSAGQVGEATTTMVVMDAPTTATAALAEAGIDVRHIFLPSQDDILQAQQQPSQHAEAQANLPEQSDLEQHFEPKQELAQQDQPQYTVESHSDSKVKFFHELLDSIQQQQQHQQQHLQNHQTAIAPTVIKLTPEDIVSLQQQLPSGALDTYQPQSYAVAQTSANTQEAPRSIEILLPSGSTRVLSLPSGIFEGRITSGAGDAGEESATVQYQVECLSGETLTEADYDTIRRTLAQASLSGGAQHLSQQ